MVTWMAWPREDDSRERGFSGRRKCCKNNPADSFSCLFGIRGENIDYILSEALGILTQPQILIFRSYNCSDIGSRHARFVG